MTEGLAPAFPTPDIGRQSPGRRGECSRRVDARPRPRHRSRRAHWRRGGDRQELHRHRVRRRRGRHRLRADVPGRRAPGRGPDPSRLRLSAPDSTQAARHPADPRPRGPHRRAALRAAGLSAAALWHGAHAGAGSGQAGRGAAGRRPGVPRGRGRRRGRDRAVPLRVLPHVSQHSRRHGHRRAHADRHDRAHGRFQARLHAGGRTPAGRADPWQARARRRAAADGRQHLRRPAGLYAVGAGGGRDLRPDLRGGAGADHRGDVLVARLARTAGLRRGQCLRAQGGADRTLDGAGAPGGRRPGIRARARRLDRGPRGAGQLSGRGHRHRLHRLTGRAALGPGADGEPGPPAHRHRARRHDHRLGRRHSRQRGKGQPHHRPVGALSARPSTTSSCARCTSPATPARRSSNWC